MAISFQQLYTQVQNLTSDTTSGSLTLFKSLINQTQNTLLAFRKDITETSTTATTVAAQQAYYLPYNYGKMFYVTVTVGSIAYPVSPLEDDNLWYESNARSSSYKSDIPRFYRIFNDQIQIFPTPSSSGNTITMYYHKVMKDMTADDYATGTITTLANAGTAVTGSGTTWTAAMVGRFMRITSDGYWYEIASRASNTSVTLKKAFQGTAISGGSEAYTIGELPIIPEAYHEMLIWRPAAIYWMQRGDTNKSTMYWHMYDGGYELSTGVRGRPTSPGGLLRQFIEDRSSKVESAIIDAKMTQFRKDISMVDPNAFPSALTS